MDEISRFLSSLGFLPSRGAQRVEASRLISEICRDIGRALDILALEIPGLLHRCAVDYPQDPTVFESCNIVLKKLEGDMEKLYEQVCLIENYTHAANRPNWDQALTILHEQRRNANRISTRVEQILKRIDWLLDHGKQKTSDGHLKRH